MPVVRVPDLTAPELAPYVSLTDAQLRSRREPEAGVLIAESPNVILAALEAGCEPLSLLGEEKKLRSSGLLEKLPALPAYTADPALLERLTGYAMTRGVLCALRRPAPKSPESVIAPARRLAVLEGVNDAANAGAIFRSAAALGVDGVLLTPDCCDPLSRRALRVSMGCVFRVPWARLPALCEGGLELLRERGFLTAALALDETALPLDDPRFSGAEKLALLLGSEGNGLRPETVAASGARVIIPMRSGVDSLNVAAAAAVAFWETRIR